jgi:hypothetical protein
MGKIGKKAYITSALIKIGTVTPSLDRNIVNALLRLGATVPSLNKKITGYSASN